MGESTMNIAFQGSSGQKDPAAGNISSGKTVISVQNLTKDYGGGRGVFDVSLDIREGEVFGYLGTNGSGKTTTIRHMMGFLKADGGTVRVNGLDPWTHSPEVMKNVSYIPGEIAFPDLKTGTDFFKVQAEFLGVRDFTYMNHLIDLLGLDPSAMLKRMSKGMKQKTAIVAALMGNREVLILDEPTTGLDPLMRETFLELIREEKAKGRTIFMSSHIFEEIEEVCDRVAIINAGHIEGVLNLSEFRHNSMRTFSVEFAEEAAARTFRDRLGKAGIDRVARSGGKTENKSEEKNKPGITVQFDVTPGGVDEAFRAMEGLQVTSLTETHPDLEDYFMDVISKGKA